MIRVLQIVPTLGFGGVAQFLLNYYKRMDNSQIVFDFITHGGKESFHDELLAKGSKIYYVKPIGSCGLVGYVKQLREILRGDIYQFVHIHTGHLTGVTALFCKLFYKGQIICHAHTTRCVNPKHSMVMPLLRCMARAFGDILLGCGVKACEFCFGKGGKYRVIHNAISLERFWNVDKSSVEDLRVKLNIANGDFVIGHIGAFVTPKNHYYVIKIFDYICRTHGNVILVLVGDGPLKNEIEELCNKLNIADRVRFVGVQSDVPLYLHLFDTFILPSLHEGLPVCAVEAQSVVGNVCISDTIDRDVDAGLGSVVFLPIGDENLSLWEQEVCKRKATIEKAKIKELYDNAGYEIESSVNQLLNVYLRYQK